MTYEIWAKYKGMKWEVIEEGIKDKKELDYLLGEYKLAYGPGWVFKTKKIREGKDNG